MFTMQGVNKREYSVFMGWGLHPLYILQASVITRFFVWLYVLIVRGRANKWDNERCMELEHCADISQK